jgi:hypothetical protein
MTCEKNDAGGGQAGIPGAALTAPDPPASLGAAAEPEEQDTPATVADATRWVHNALWISPYVDISQARFEEWGSVHMESLDTAGGTLTAHLENGQVFTITVTESAA